MKKITSLLVCLFMMVTWATAQNQEVNHLFSKPSNIKLGKLYTSATPTPADGFGYANPVSYTHLTLPTNREV